MEKKQKTLEGNPSRSSKNLIVTIAIFVLIVALIVVGLLILRKHKKPREDTTEMPYYSSVSGELATAEDGSPITVRQNPTMRVAGTAPIAGTTVPAGQTAAATTRAAGSASTTTAANGANRGAASTTRASGGGSNSGNGGGTANNTPAPAPAATTKASGGGSNVDSAAELRDVNSFINGVFAMEGTMVDGDEGQRVSITTDGTNFKFGVTMDNISLTMLFTGGKIYGVNPNEKKFADFTQLFGSEFGMDGSELQEIQSYLSNFTSTADFSNGVRSEGTYSGSRSVIYDFKQDTGEVIRFTLVNNNLKRMTVLDETGEELSGIVFTSFTGNLPANSFSLAGYEKQSPMEFLSAMGLNDADMF